MATIGSVGIGLIWGWLMVQFGDRQPRRPLLNRLVLVLITAVAATQLYFLVGTQSPFFFLGAALITLLMHYSWRHSLRLRLSK